MNFEQTVDIAYEDENFLLANKPSSLHSERKTSDAPQKITASDILSTRYPQLVLLNRLDFETSGLLIAGKSAHAAEAFKAAQRSGAVRKYYFLLAEGEFPKACRCIAFIGSPYRRAQKVRTYEEEPGKRQRASSAETHFELEKFLSDRVTSLVRAELRVGRRHQVRAHAAHLGYPLVGDKLYGAKTELGTIIPEFSDRAFFLFAYRVQFKCPLSDRDIDCSLDLPVEINRFV